MVYNNFSEQELPEINSTHSRVKGSVFSKKISFNKWYVGLFLILLLLFGAIATLALVTVFYPQNNIGIIDIQGPITSYEKYKFITDMVKFSRDNESIKAIILRIDSPGGYVTTTQDIYMNLLDLRERKPIVACINGLGVSGAYYIALSADYIYALPAARIGNIGVIATLPAKPEPLENVLETGPYKQRGVSESLFPFEVQSILDEFLNAVELQREGSLNVSRTELSKGLMYLGKQALENGLIDGIGSSQDAIVKAAELGKISRYSTVVINDMVEEPFIASSNLAYDRSGLTLDKLMKLHVPPAFYYIYANPEINYDVSTRSTSWPIERVQNQSKRQLEILFLWMFPITMHLHNGN